MQDQKRQRTSDARARLIGGLLAALPSRGYAKVTIADIVRGAGVSKRTFYEHFQDKEACFLAAYELLSERTLKAVASAADPTLPWDRQVAAAVQAYVDVFGVNPQVSRVFMSEVYAAGPRAVALQRETHARFAKLLRRLVTRSRKNNPQLQPLSASMATVLVGGINELVLVSLHSQDAKMKTIEPTITRLVATVLGHVDRLKA
jgi:AcrR family transcriptional regulator